MTKLAKYQGKNYLRDSKTHFSTPQKSTTIPKRLNPSTSFWKLVHLIALIQTKSIVVLFFQNINEKKQHFFFVHRVEKSIKTQIKTYLLWCWIRFLWKRNIVSHIILNAFLENLWQSSQLFFHISLYFSHLFQGLWMR